MARGAKRKQSLDDQAPRRLGRRWGIVVVVVACLVIVGVQWLGGSAEAALEAPLRDVARAVSSPPGDTRAARRQRIEAAIDRNVAAVAHFRIEELPSVSRADEALVNALVELVDPGEVATLEITRVETTRRGTSATAVVDVRLAADTGRDLHAPHRRLTLQLARDGDRWRIVGADVPAETQPEPEARP